MIQKIIMKVILSLGIHKIGQIFLQLAKIIAEETKTTKDDKIVQIAIEVWQDLQDSIPMSLKKIKRSGLKQ